MQWITPAKALWRLLFQRQRVEDEWTTRFRPISRC